MNIWVGGVDDKTQPGLPTPGYVASTKVSEILAPANTWVLLDERPESLDDGCFATDLAGFSDEPGRTILADYPAPNHADAAGLAFADGHAEIHRWLDERTVPSAQPGVRLPKNAPSPNNPDVAWLQQRSGARKP